jgi:hypothetical protein
MDGARFHGTGPEYQGGTGRYGRRTSPRGMRILAAVAAFLAVMLIVTMTNVLPILATTTGMDHDAPSAGQSHSRMRF